MVLVFVAVITAGLLVAAGAWYRWSSLVLALLFTYLFLIEKTNYQNHYYLMMLLAWWLPLLKLNVNVAVGCNTQSLNEKSSGVPLGTLDFAIPYRNAIPVWWICKTPWRLASWRAHAADLGIAGPTSIVALPRQRVCSLYVCFGEGYYLT